MAGGYRHDPEGTEGVTKRFKDLQAQHDSLRGSSRVKKAILRGDVMTFQTLAGSLATRVGEFVGEFFNGSNWVADVIRGLQVTKPGDTQPFAHVGPAEGHDRIDVVFGFGETALTVCYVQTGEFWVSGPGGSMFYIDPSGYVNVFAGSGQTVNITGDGVIVNGGVTVNGGLVVDDLRVDGDVGFYGTSPQGQQNVTGSRASGAALANLLSKLENIGIINDSTSA
jgi:hypothetical protein